MKKTKGNNKHLGYI